MKTTSYMTLTVQVLTWAKQHEQRLETALTEVLNNANLLEELLSWLQWAETTLVQRDTEPLPQDIPELKTLITEHQVGFPLNMHHHTCGQPEIQHSLRYFNADLFLLVLSNVADSLLVFVLVRCLWRR